MSNTRQRADGSRPAVIAKFQNGELDINTAHHLNCGYFVQTGKPPALCKRKVVVESAKCDYIGYSSKQTAGGNTCRYLLGAVNKSTGKLRVFDVDIFDMKPKWVVDGAVNSDNEEEKPEQTYGAKLDTLTSAFGSTGKRKSKANRKKSMLNSSVLESTVGTAVNEETQLKLNTPVKESTVSVSDTLPPHDVTALTPQDAYKVKDVVPEFLMSTLQTAAEVFVKATRDDIDQWAREEKYPGFILSQLKTLPQDPESRSRRASYVMYANCLITQFQMKPYLKPRKHDQLAFGPEVPEKVRKYLISTFTLRTEDGLCCLPARLKDKTLSYLLVLCLILDEFELDYTQLRKDLKVGMDRINLVLKGIGCKIKTKKPTSGEAVYIAELPVPLTFPDLTKRGKGKKRK